MYTINLLDRDISADRSSATVENGHQFNVVRNPFICPYCSEALPTAQALGGHQNAEERWNSPDQERPKKAKEIQSQIPKPLGNGQIIDFWAKQLAKPAELYSHGGPIPDENQKWKANWEMDRFVERDFMAEIAGHGGDDWLGEFPVIFGGTEESMDLMSLLPQENLIKL